MAKKVVIISTSLRGGSNSDILARECERGAKEAGHEVEYISLKGKEIKYCIGCLSCQAKGVCVLKDDVAEIMAKVKDAEVLVFATPIYYYEMAGQMKTLLDRLNPLFPSDYAFRDVYMIATAAEDAVAYTLKMSYKTDYRIEGFFDYVVPPLEGFWWQDGVDGIDYSDKSTFNWISVIRLPDFVTRKDFDWAVKTAEKKKHLDCNKAEFLTIDEGLCVQLMHIGPFDDEPATVSTMNAYLLENGYENDFSGSRLHHEIYLSDARKVAPEKWKTVIRHPIKRKEA